MGVTTTVCSPASFQKRRRFPTTISPPPASLLHFSERESATWPSSHASVAAGLLAQACLPQVAHIAA